MSMLPGCECDFCADGREVETTYKIRQNSWIFSFLGAKFAIAFWGDCRYNILKVVISGDWWSINP